MYNTDKKFRWLQPVVIILLVVMFFANFTENAKAAGKTPELNITELSMSVGQAKTLSVSNNKKKVQWTSSKKSVATVSSKGKIKAKKAGKTIITAKIGNKKLKCNVIVNKPSQKKKDVLIVYFSQTGTTKAVADKIQKLTGGDLLQIQEKDKYPNDYDKTVERAKKELNKKSFPKIKTQALNMKSYDVVYVGFPIWWHSTPRVVNTFLKQYNFKGKTVIPFCTSGGSDISEALPEIKELCKGSTILEGYTADSGSKSEIKKWLTKIGQIGDNSKSEKR
ncbi:MAG: flavodoxin [Lachnospiraceae bacterium]|nr:flavodoxin [Lachnospiraceae bacterium]